MKHVLSVALLGALAAGPAFAAGSGQSSTPSGQTTSESSPSMSSQSGTPGSMSSQSSQSGQQASADQSTVRQIQQALKDKGYDVGQVDGVMGENTRQALMKFQKDQGMQASGQLDQQTMAALQVEGATTQQGQVPSSEPSTSTPGSAGSSSGTSGTTGMGGTGSTGGSSSGATGSPGGAGSSSGTSGSSR